MSRSYGERSALVRKTIFLTDPRVIMHFYNSERTVYVRTESTRFYGQKGKHINGTLWQLVAMGRSFTPELYELAYKVLVQIVFLLKLNYSG
ncbi:hypothetical protein B0H17DRAFT_1219152 [Mycena rosella]|uniref:Uncharacterized protein n=1 Tax=Mycena rosella TaxID=1033263 RepID=A0AAD7BJ86_MYCRO|nr:hypothetical protein B0H17DRAFT_1219152 [Mycena rosella]